MEYITFILTIASIVVPVTATILIGIYTVERRVKAEHKPYIVLDSITNISKIEKSNYFITMLGNKFRKKYLINEEENKNMIDNSISVKIRLKNIGYGVATNIRFYNLDTAYKINGNQEVNENIDQQLFTTFDIAAGEIRSVQTALAAKEKDKHIMEDTIHTVCMYQDLNGNIYDFVFSIDIKSGGGYSYYAYQPSSHSYKELMDKYKQNKKKILIDYKK